MTLSLPPLVTAATAMDAMNIFLPHGLKFNVSVAQDAIGEMLLPLSGPQDYVRTPTQERAAKTVAVIRDLKDRLHKMTTLPRTLSEAGVQKDSLGKIAPMALKDPAINFNPVAAGYEDVELILQRAF